MINNTFIGVCILLFFSISMILFIGLVSAIIDEHGEFEYVTSSGETGTASFCTVSYGQSICRTNDGTTIMVEKYIKNESV